MEEGVLECYEAIRLASGRMLSAARSNDLDGLAAAEAECAAMIARLRVLGDGPGLSPEGARRKMGIIRRVLDDDARIRELTQPWLQSLERLMQGATGQRKLHGAYG
jgi:flagellar protein FliT